MSAFVNTLLTIVLPVIPSIALCGATIGIGIAAIVLYLINRKNYDLRRELQGNPFNEVISLLLSIYKFFYEYRQLLRILCTS